MNSLSPPRPSARGACVALLLAAHLLGLPAYLQAQNAQGDPTTAQRLVDLGEAESAIAILDPWLKKHPKDAEALLLRSTARFMLGEISRGTRDLDRSLKLDPGNRKAWLNRAALELSNEKYSAALEAFTRAEALDPEAPENSLNIGAALLLLDRFDEAESRFRDYLARHPSDPEARYLVASNYAMRGFAGPAVANLKRAIAINEKMRRRARTDPNFGPLEDAPSYRQLLETDSYRMPNGSRVMSERFDAPFGADERLVLDAVISSLQLQGRPFDPQVEVASRWALVWSDLRIKVAADGAGGTLVELSVPPGKLSTARWQARTSELLRGIRVQLHARGRRLSRPNR